MARRRFGRTRAAIRSVRSYAREKRRNSRTYSKRSSTGNPLMTIVLPAAAYGAVRAPLKNTVMPYIPAFAGDNTDEIVMGVGGYLLMKHTTGFMHDFGKAALYVESASLGNNLISPMISQAVGTTSGNTGNYNITQVTGAY